MRKALMLSTVLLVVMAAPCKAQDEVAAFYAGKQVRIIVGVGVGSGYDIAARTIAPPHGQAHSRQARRSSCRTSPAPAAPR